MTNPQTPKPDRPSLLPVGGLVTLLSTIADAGADEDRVTIGEITKALGPAGMGGAILLPALLAVSPASAVFGVATVCGLTIALIAAQIMAKARRLWLPGWIRRRRIRRSVLVALRDRLTPWFAWIERKSRPRLTLLQRDPLGIVPGVVTFAIGLSMPLLELVPMSATTGGAAVTLMVLGLLLDDGVLVLAGLAASALVALLVFTIGSGVTELLGV
ncbi:MAG: exopolysaccharide biosynthesis protein [Jannaschia sp.]